MANKVLFVAYHYPPITVSSGVHRTLAFTRFLSDWQWDVSVLTTSYKAYASYDLAQMKSVPTDVKVMRARAWDTARDWSFRGKYFRLLAVPDRFQSWIIGGVFRGLLSIWRMKPSVIISTYPIATAHIIGYLLNKITGIPWIADFRDPMAQEGYPADPLIHKSFCWIERKVFDNARFVVFVTQGAKEYYEKRFQSSLKYPDQIQIISNGFDEQAFKRIPSRNTTPKYEEFATNCSPDTTVKILHSGVVYPVERNPAVFFSALAELKSAGSLESVNLKIFLRATGNDKLLSEQIAKHNLDDIFFIVPPIPYEEALNEMNEADILLLLQADNCNDQIPAKAYEYIRIGRPVLALADPKGETGKLMAKLTNAVVTALEDKEGIKKSILTMLASFRQLPANPQEFIASHSREGGARQLERLIRLAMDD